MAKRKKPIPAEVFLSHAGRDRRRADRLAKILREHDVSVWYSRTHIVGAQQWHDEIGAALARCDWFLLLLTPNAVQSRWVKRELLFALSEAHYENRIVPLLYRDCKVKELSWTLPASQFVDFTRSVAEGCQELMRIWGLEYRAH